jgi:hypothetical protein
MAAPGELAGEAEVEADRPRMSDVQPAARLGREAGHDLPVVAARRHVVGDLLAQEVARGLVGVGARRAAHGGGI